MANQMVGNPLKPGKNQTEKRAIEILEEAVRLLKISPIRYLTYYYTGSLPFVLGLLYFWGDMSTRALSDQHCAVAAFGLSLLFIWMKFWQTLFTVHISATIHSMPVFKGSLKNIIQIIAIQTMIHSTGLFILPIAFVLAFPFAWLYAFYQNVTVLGADVSGGARSVSSRAWIQANLFPGKNLLLLFILSLFGGFIFLNIGISIYLLPHLLNKLLGLETIFTMSGFSVLNTTFLVAACSMVYLCLDPIVKTVYVIRCFYGQAIRTGEDLKAKLEGVSFALKASSLSLLILFSGGFPDNGLAQEPISNTFVKQGLEIRVLPGQLDRSIQEVIHQREFLWRLPIEKSKQEKQDKASFEWLALIKEWLGSKAKQYIKAFGGWMVKVLKWIGNLMPEIKPEYGETDTGRSVNAVRTALYLLVAFLLIVMLYYLRRFWKQRYLRPVPAVAEEVRPVPDLFDEQVSADELPVEQWLSLAKKLIADGSFRPALRALYLAILVHLSEKEKLTLAGYKSNREYEVELKRRAHNFPELVHDFSASVALFDRAWYGSYPVSLRDLDHFSRVQERIMTR